MQQTSITFSSTTVTEKTTKKMVPQLLRKQYMTNYILEEDTLLRIPCRTLLITSRG